jgi:hypothetical protein
MTTNNILSLEITDEKKKKMNGELYEKHLQEILVRENERGEFEKVVRERTSYYYPKDRNGIPDLNWRSRIWDEWSDDSEVLKKRLSLFWDFIIKNKNHYLLIGKPLWTTTNA